MALSYFNKIQTSKICSMVKCLSHPMHIGGSSPFNKKEWVRKEWPMCNWAIAVSSCPRTNRQEETVIHSFNTGNNLYNLYSRNSSHSDCYSSNIYLFVHGFRSLPSLVISVYNSKIWTKTGWSYFRFNIDCNDERESDNIKNDFSLE